MDLNMYMIGKLNYKLVLLRHMGVVGWVPKGQALGPPPQYPWTASFTVYQKWRVYRGPEKHPIHSSGDGDKETNQKMARHRRKGR